MEQNIERRQLLSLGVVLFLAPALRLFPAEAASAAGRASWLTPLAALPLLVFYAAFLTKLLSLRREGEALPELLGRAAGKPALALTALWLLLYAAFVLRAGADRFVGTVYPRASYAVFAEVMGALALAGALAGPRALARMGRMLLPFVLGVLLMLLAISLRGVRLDNLWPLRPSDLPGLARGALAPLDVVAGAAAALCFPARAEKQTPGARRALTLWMLGLWDLPGLSHGLALSLGALALPVPPARRRGGGLARGPGRAEDGKAAALALRSRRGGARARSRAGRAAARALVAGADPGLQPAVLLRAAARGLRPREMAGEKEPGAVKEVEGERSGL